MEQFLPALVALASTDWELMKPVAVHMLAMLVDKMKKRGLALVSDNLPSNVSIMHKHITTLNLNYNSTSGKNHFHEMNGDVGMAQWK